MPLRQSESGVVGMVERASTYFVVLPVAVHHPVLAVGADLQFVRPDVVAVLRFSGNGALRSDGCQHGQKAKIHLEPAGRGNGTFNATSHHAAHSVL